MLLYLQTPFSTMVGSSPEGEVHPFLGRGEGPKLHTILQARSICKDWPMWEREDELAPSYIVLRPNYLDTAAMGGKLVPPRPRGSRLEHSSTG